jgi:hypothetical protein
MTPKQEQRADEIRQRLLAHLSAEQRSLAADVAMNLQSSALPAMLVAILKGMAFEDARDAMNAGLATFIECSQQAFDEQMEARQ